jgi:hypothetical protein
MIFPIRIRRHDHTYLPPHPKHVWSQNGVGMPTYLPTPTLKRTIAKMGLPNYLHRSAVLYYPTLEEKRNPARARAQNIRSAALTTWSTYDGGPVGAEGGAPGNIKLARTAVPKL